MSHSSFIMNLSWWDGYKVWVICSSRYRTTNSGNRNNACHMMINFKSARFKGDDIWLTRLDLCAGETGATIDVECFSCNKKRDRKRNCKNIWQKEILESLAQDYIEIYMLWMYSLLVTQCNSWVFVLDWLVWNVIQCNTMQEYNGLSDWLRMW